MTVLDTAIDPRHPSYLQNRSTMLERLGDLESALEAARAGGGEKHVTRHHARGKLLPRERIELLLDQDTPFLELAAVAAWGTDSPIGAGVVTGIGVVEGVECVVVASDPTVHGGAVNPYTAAKIHRAVEIAGTNRLPLVMLVESTGGGAGAVLGDLSRLSARRIPTVSVVFGAATGDAAYLPGLSDFTIMVRGQARVTFGRPTPPRPVGGQRADDESVGGASGHATGSGLADFLAEDERDGVRLARQCVRRLNWRKQGPPPRTSLPAEPKHSVEDLLTIAGCPPGAVPDPREILARILDGSEFDEFKPAYGPAIVAGWGEVHGYPVGVLADADRTPGAAEAQKAAQFVQLANGSATSLVLLRHTGGPGEDGPAAAASVKHRAVLANALANSAVPHLVVTTGPAARPEVSDGCLTCRPRFLFSWPSEQAERTTLPERIAAESAALRSSGLLHDDGVIDPRDTRTVLGLCLSAVHSGPVEGATTYGVFRT